MLYIGNYFLNMDEMRVNAEYILAFLSQRGWTRNAVCGMLGNMQSESTINPGIWQSLDFGNTSGGFGLVQWTPASKYLDWASLNGYVYHDMDANLNRILYEVENNIQYYNDNQSFAQFTHSLASAYDLAVDFLHHYERPAEYHDVQRGTQAVYWYDVLTGLPPWTPPSDEEMMLIIGSRRLSHRRRSL